jgi:hypothetical protein
MKDKRKIAEDALAYGIGLAVFVVGWELFRYLAHR